MKNDIPFQKWNNTMEDTLPYNETWNPHILIASSSLQRPHFLQNVNLKPKFVETLAFLIRKQRNLQG